MERLVRGTNDGIMKGKDRNRFSQFECTKKKRTIPFGLGEDTAQVLRDILDADGSLMESVAGLMSQAKATGTMENYERTTAKFKEFCEQKGYEYPKFGEKAVLHYVIQMDKDKASFAVLCQIKPALMLVEQLAGATSTAFTEMVNVFLTAAKRRAAMSKPIVRKAGTLPDDVLQLLHGKYLVETSSVDKSVDPVMLRTFVRAVIVYFTFCRFSCYSKLRAMDLEDNGTSITVTFPFAKNDQFHNGQASCIVNNDSSVNPVELVRLYYKLCDFKFGKEKGDTSLLNCVIRRKKNTWVADGTKAISYATGTKNLRDMLAGIGIQSASLTDKSFKMLGVTRTLEKGTALEDVMHQGRWRTVTMPLHYKVNSLYYKESVAGNVPV